MDDFTTGELLIMRTSLSHVQATEDVGALAPLFASAEKKILVALGKREDLETVKQQHLLIIFNKLN